MMKTYRDVVFEHATLHNTIDDLEKALRELRDNCQNWEKDIEKDNRPSVKLLYGSLKSHRSKLAAFMEVEIYNAPREAPNGL